SAAAEGSLPTGISTDHRFVLFEGDAFTLVADDGAGITDVYVREDALGMTTRSSSDPDGVGGDGASRGSRMSADSRFVAFVSDATGLVVGETTSGSCAFLPTQPLHAPSSTASGTGLAGTNGIPALAAATDPLLNQPCDVDVGNSSGAWTVALLLIGTETADVPTRLGGDLLLVPIWTSLIAVAPNGAT